MQDELLWAAAWLHEATGDQYYLNYMIDNAGSLGGTTMAMNEFSRDDKYARVQVLASKVRLCYQWINQFFNDCDFATIDHDLKSQYV